MQRVQFGACGVKECIAPGLRVGVTTVEEMGLGVVFEASRATQIDVLPDSFGFLRGKNAM
jgi:hypothetical protein